MIEVQLEVAGYPDSDAREVAELTLGLERDLLMGAVEHVTRPSGDAPPGAKGSALEWAQLVVTLAGALPPLLTAVRGWVGRHPGAAVSLEIDGDRLTVDEATLDERRELIGAWMKRHGG